MNKSQFKKLKDTWYKKLKKSGFVDIEKNEYGDLKESSAIFANTKASGVEKPLIYNTYKEEYYRLANQFLNEHAFETSRERAIWEYHANGMSIRDIVKTLKKVRIKAYKHGVWGIIVKLRILMKQKYGVTK